MIRDFKISLGIGKVTVNIEPLICLHHVKVKLFLIMFCTLSCSTGHNDHYGIYVPNNPRYNLKDKKGDEIPKELDTLNVYKYYGYFDSNSNELIKTNQKNEWGIYKKFAPNGRFYNFGTYKLEEKSLDPNYGDKGYYVYNKNNSEIRYEVFTNGNGGQFVILECKLSKEGDTIKVFDNEKNIKFTLNKKFQKNGRSTK